MASKEILATMSRKGQVTIPAEVRKHLGVDYHDKIAFVLDSEKGEVHIKAPRYPDLESVRGAAGSLPKPLAWEAMQTIAHEDHVSAKLANPHE